jgi:hypothetical protein
MHRAIRSLVLATAVLAASSGLAAAKSFVINPQAGLTASHRSNDPGDLSTSGRVGWSLGGNIRLGGKAYIAPGVYFQRTNIQLSQKDTVSTGTVEDILGVQSIHVPLLVGVNMSSNANGPGLGFRLFGGPALTIVQKVDANDFGITKDDYKSSSVGIQAGAGLDLAVLTVDVSYEAALGKVLKDSDAKQQTIRAALGLKL